MKPCHNPFREFIREDQYQEETIQYERHALQLYPRMAAFFYFGYGLFLLLCGQERLLEPNNAVVALWICGLVSLLFSHGSMKLIEPMTLDRIYGVMGVYCIITAAVSYTMWILWDSISLVMFFMFIVSSSIIWLSYKRYLLFSLVSIALAFLIYIILIPDQSFSVLYLLDNFIVAIFAIGINILHTSEQYRAFRLQQQLEHDRDTDALTELKNRKALVRCFRQDLTASQLLTLVLIDIDNFKSVNDTFGHQAGDQVLVRVSRIMQNTFRSSDAIARIGGDEFVVLMPLDWVDLPLVEMKLKGLLDQVPILVTDGTNELKATLSIGAYIQPTQKDTALDSLIELADEAMYRSKKGGKNRATIQNADGNYTTLTGGWEIAEGRIISVE